MSTFNKGDRALVPVNRQYCYISDGSLVEVVTGPDSAGDYRVRVLQPGSMPDHHAEVGDTGFVSGADLVAVGPTETTAPLFELIPPVPAKPSVRVTLTAAQVEYLYDLTVNDPDIGDEALEVHYLLEKVKEALR